MTEQLFVEEVLAPPVEASADVLVLGAATSAGTWIEHDHFYGGRYRTIPYRCYVPVGIDNLLVAGRCLSATHEAQSAVRCMANTIAMGEAVGTAAALALRSGRSPREIDVCGLQCELLRHGAWLGEVASRKGGSKTGRVEL